jgi:hypothetical protein
LRVIKIIVCVLLIATVTGAWINAIGKVQTSGTEYDHFIEAATKSFELGLFDQSVEQYKSALSIRPSLELWQKIKEVRSAQYSAIPDERVRADYIADMQAALLTYSEEKDFWITVLNLQLAGERDADAYRAAKEAIRAVGSVDEIVAIADALRYKTEVDYRIWSDIKTPMTGFVTAAKNDLFYMLNNTGDTVRGEFSYIGPISADGYGVYQTSRGFRLMDLEGVERAVFPGNVETAGVYASDVKLVPLKVNGKWRYYGLDDYAQTEVYDAASAFVNGYAVVSMENKWFVIDADATVVRELPFDEVQFGLGGEFLQHGVIIAKSAGKWRLYNEKYEQIGDFSADGMDVCNNGELIAYQENGKWGFVAVDGSIAIEAQYAAAKSFSDGLAAVRMNDSLFGFIDDKGILRIAGEYPDAGYFAENGGCFVLTKDGWQLLKFALK